MLLVALALSACTTVQGAPQETALFEALTLQAAQEAADAARRCGANTRTEQNDDAHLLLLRLSTPRKSKRCIVDWYFEQDRPGLFINISVLPGL